MSTELDGEIGWNTAEMMDICTYTDDYDGMYYHFHTSKFYVSVLHISFSVYVRFFNTDHRILRVNFCTPCYVVVILNEFLN